MTQELIDLRTSILEQRYEDALAIVEDLEGMSRQAILRNIQSFLLRLLIHLIKNQVEQRLTNSWAASIRGSLRDIAKLNLKDNKTSYYVKSAEWSSMLAEEFDEAIATASLEVMDGAYSPFQLAELVDRELVTNRAIALLNLIYNHSVKDLTTVINNELTQLDGGEAWKSGNRQSS